MKNFNLLFYLMLTLICSISSHSQENPDFYLHENGVTCMCPDADFGDSGELIINGEAKVFTKRTQQELESLVQSNLDNPEIALTCTSGIEIMHELFSFTSFNQDIGSWDVSNVSVMNGIFFGAFEFNQDISNWDVTGTDNLGGVFSDATSFNQDIGNWDISNATNLNGMFANASSFNQDISNWDTSNVTIMNGMFLGNCGFNQDISNWDTSNVTSMDMMFFLNTSFNQDLSDWCLPFINEEPDNFATDSLLDDDFFPNWDSDCGTFMIEGNFVFDNITQICYCEDADFGETATFEVDGIMRTFTKRTEQELRNLIDNFENDDSQDISLTCTSSITNMSNLFESQQDFNLPLSYWDVSNVTDMSFMFSQASSFNQNISNWDVSNVTTMSRMFSTATSFNQPIGSWDVSSVIDMSFMFIFATSFNQPIDNWDVSNVINMAQMLAASDYDRPINSWNISNVTDINAMFALTSFNQPLDQWDTSSVDNMAILFNGNESFNQDISMWDVSNVTSMSGMFFSSSNFNQPLGSWDVSNVTQMNGMFMDATNFNQDISTWCVENITVEPEDFSSGSAIQTSFLPNWGEECQSFNIDNEFLSSFKLYPNPTSGNLNFEWNRNQKNEKLQIKIYAVDGKLISVENYKNAPQNINVSNLPSGVYLLHLNTSNQSIVKRLIKK